MKYNYWYEFSRIRNLNPIKKYKLIDHFKSAEAFYTSSDYEIIKTGLISKEKINAIRSITFIKDIDDILYKRNISIINIFSREYPKLLKEIYDPPVVLYVKGNIELLNYNKVSIVGSRKSSAYSRHACINISNMISNNKYVVVSGLAKGIDTYAHKGSNDFTIAVLAFGFDHIYPLENKQLYEKLQVKSLCVSEYPPYVKPEKYHFVERNRIISGLSIATIIIQAASNSGSLITANFTIENNRELFVLPQRIYNDSYGSNSLINDGATMIVSLDELLTQIKTVEIS